ncbi:aminotransferase [Xaviernesmea oryzae]|uniref:Aminotransferase n=1 Tax=Xaviernesmea oryzae TaxID=464029 RepID=A0A1Q9B2J7_9HYPH|nr:SIS domain-containing protein [Xaviernesmea oryzae]OLP62250.1 aminotransferase [Xaviernesmea oryzae]SEL93272.1 glucosamine--fructose-6-phosphate aminotransferase (isomerizing) [Xaviernesmea oryzae]
MTQTHMRREINEIPEAVQRFLDTSGQAAAKAGEALRERDPAFVVTVARGSSDHAALFLKYAIELTAGRPVASIGPSLASIYGARLKLTGGAAIAISQSGKSPDIVALAEAARDGGALGIALTNTLPSPMADAMDHAINIAAGPELAVAATKSYVNSIVAGLAVLAAWTKDEALERALAALPGHLADAVTLDWSRLAGPLKDAGSLYMLGRGPALAIANEAALKFKETSNLHAEAYSSAEVLHGPVALVERAFPVIGLVARDAAESSVNEILDGLQAKGARAFATSHKAAAATKLPFVETGHPLTDALALVVPFYGFVESWSRACGFNPDQPVALKKVTETR